MFYNNMSYYRTRWFAPVVCTMHQWFAPLFTTLSSIYGSIKLVQCKLPISNEVITIQVSGLHRLMQTEETFERTGELISASPKPKVEGCTCSRVVTNVSEVCISQCEHEKNLLFLL